ncbi:hypothetical protein BU16DRAFT_531566 [Lophium mytilinum]|uniref:Uncharacterized protein n=1 Tax=Lophium mytilinum TaxID=390894 RepID=A0A6A6QAD6_9PEZI|nr:hypothetical protein BU16DRAFT_531566 [Lophium mytilinum]
MSLHHQHHPAKYVDSPRLDYDRCLSRVQRSFHHAYSRRAPSNFIREAHFFIQKAFSKKIDASSNV